MTVTTTAMQTALRGLNEALDAPRLHGALGPWRNAVSERMAFVREGLSREAPVGNDGWLAGRSRAMQRECRTLLGRMYALGTRVEQTMEVDLIRMELKRLVVDINHHVQKLNDLAYDDVEMEIGGSE